MKTSFLTWGLAYLRTSEEKYPQWTLEMLKVSLILALAFSVTLAPAADQLLAVNQLDLSWFLTWGLVF